MTIAIVPRRAVGPDERAAFNKHVCPPEFDGNNPDLIKGELNIREGDKSLIAPGKTVVRHLSRELLVDFDLRLPNGQTVPMWIIGDPDDNAGETFPSKRVRVCEGEVVHAQVSGSGDTHTIHWHGIEPSTMNDGVGKLSFELGDFTYQWRADCAGTYFYHCHKNTTLHFIRGLFGLLIIDPPRPTGVAGPDPPYPDGGPGFVRRQNDIVRYDVEQWLLGGELDTRWTSLDENAFMQRCDSANPVNPRNFTQNGFLNDFCPDIFYLAGVNGKMGVAKVDPQGCRLPRTPASLDFPAVGVTAKVNDTVLLRVENTGYTLKQYRFGSTQDQGKLSLEIIAMDGRPLGYQGCNGQFSAPFQLQPGQPLPLPVGPLSSARRFDLLIRPTAVGTFPVQVEFFDWRATFSGSQPDPNFLYATARTTISVS
jgi:FtsP/CotA-like multicopper oxidase with cupredoxin domain